MLKISHIFIAIMVLKVLPDHTEGRECTGTCPPANELTVCYPTCNVDSDCVHGNCCLNACGLKSCCHNQNRKRRSIFGVPFTIPTVVIPDWQQMLNDTLARNQALFERIAKP